MITMRADWNTPWPRPSVCNDAEVAVNVVLRTSPADRGEDLGGQTLALSNGMLSVGHGFSARDFGAEVRDGGAVADSPGMRHWGSVGAHAQVGSHLEETAFVGGKVGVLGDDRIRGVAGRPHNELRVELLAGGQHHVAVLGRPELGVQMDTRASFFEGTHHPPAGIGRNFGQDAALCFDEPEVEFGDTELGVGLEQCSSTLLCTVNLRAGPKIERAVDD